MHQLTMFLHLVPLSPLCQSGVSLMSSLAVVPIFVNAGAALLPAIVAGLTSLLAALASPRALWTLCRRRPGSVLATLAAIALLIASIRWATAAKTPDPAKTDWAAVAREILRQQAATQTASQHILRQLWHHDLDGGIPLSTPRIVAGKVIAPVTIMDLASKYGVIWALDLETGKPLWKAAEISPGQDFKAFFSSPAVTADNRRIIIGEGLHEDADCRLHCIDLDTGKTLWSIATPLHIESSPAILTRQGRETAVVGVGAIEGPDRQATGDGPWHAGYVLAVDIATGQELWRHKITDPESSPAVDPSGNIYIGSGVNGSAVVALRPDADDALTAAGTPRILWRRTTDYPATGNVTLSGNLVLIGAGNGDYVFSDPHPAGQVLALDKIPGNVHWKTPLPDSVLGSLTVIADKVLAGCRNGEIFALALSDGHILWHAKVSATSAAVLGGVSTKSSHVFALASDGTLAVIDLDTGAVTERLLLADEGKTSQNLSLAIPVVTQNKLIVGTETGGIRCFEIAP